MIQKQNASIYFAQGLDQKTDPNQVPFGKFLSLQNMVFTTGKRLTKRNGFGSIAAVPTSSGYLTTLNGDLTALGSKIQAYSSEFQNWSSIGNFYPCNLSTLSVVRSSTNQSQSDSAISSSGLLCMVWTDQNPTNLSANQYKYAVYDSTTGQQLLAPVVISDADPTYGFPRVFVLGNYFAIIYTSSSPYHIKCIPISLVSLIAGTTISITNTAGPFSTGAWDAAILNDTLFIAWNGSGSVGINITSISSTLTVSSTINPDAHSSTDISVCVDSTANIVYVNYYNASTYNGYTVAINTTLTVLSGFPVQSINSLVLSNISSCVSTSGKMNLFLDVTNSYSYDSSIKTNYIESSTVTQSAVVSSPSILVRSLGLASKAFSVYGVPYFLGAYTSTYQPTYFLINGLNGNVVSELAYENGSGYVSSGLPSVTVVGSTASVSYLIKDFIQSLSNANSSGTTTVGGIYSQTGISQATFTIGNSAVITSAEIGNNLNISAGFLWGYDGTQATEQGFFLWPEFIEASLNSTGGFLTAQKYYYQILYSWTDNRGNIFRSSGSIPLLADLSSSGTSTNSVGLFIPTLRLSYKNNVKIEIYRWSTTNPTFYQITSIKNPLMNNPSADYVTFNDNQLATNDANAVGNEIIYTTGGVVENIGGPSFKSTFTFDDRLWGIDSEDNNLLWFSKQAVEGAPIEMSDLLTVYVAPSIGAQGNTGPLTCGAEMDDKVILFKQRGLLYINGSGPDNTGANSGYSQPTFITSMVGCSNQASIVFQPGGLMFEFASEAGNQIWMLGRDLSTQYIGAPVERLTLSNSVTSAVAIPGTNQVRFSLSNGSTLVYDYFYGQWSEFTINAQSSTLYQGLHTFINSNGSVFQETPGIYLDGSSPVVMSFTTSWLNLTGLQGYQRSYWFYLLGQYISPHKLQLGIAYDYNPSSTQSIIISPSNFSGIYGLDLPYGDSSPYGGPGNLEQWKIFLNQQRCQAFQIQMQEIYDPTFGVTAGAGLTLSGLNLVFGQKKGYVPLPFNQGAS